MAIIHKLTVNEMYFTPLFNLVLCSTQVDFSLEAVRGNQADIMQQMLKVHKLLLFYCSRVAKSYLLKLIDQDNWHFEDKQVHYILSYPHSMSDSGASRSTVPSSRSLRIMSPCLRNVEEQDTPLTVPWRPPIPGSLPRCLLSSWPPPRTLPYGFRPTFRSSKMWKGILLEGQEHGLWHA